MNVTRIGRMIAIACFWTFSLIAAGVTITDTDPESLVFTDSAPSSPLAFAFRYFRILAIFSVLWFYPVLLKALNRNLTIAFAIFVFFISTLWSQSRYETFSASLNVLLLLSVCVIVINAWGVSRAIFALWVFGVVMMLISCALAYLDSPYAISDQIDAIGAWRGLFATKNGFGSVCAMLLLGTLFFQPIREVNFFIRLVVLAVCVYGLIMSRSVGSTFAAVTAIVITLGVLGLRKVKNFGAAVYVVALVLLIAVLIALVIAFPIIVAALGRDLTFTGRTLIWASVFSLTLSAPFGYGYGIAGGELVTAAVSQELGVLYKAVDNGFLVLALDCGWLFVSLYVFWLIRFIFKPLSKRAAGYLGDGSLIAVASFMFMIAWVEKIGGPYLNYCAFTLAMLYFCSRAEMVQKG